MDMAAVTGLPPAAPACAIGGADADILGRIGNLTVRLARTGGEVRAAKDLRRLVFFPGIADCGMPAGEDSFDLYCDHLLVIDDAGGGEARIAGTYRLLRQDRARLAGGWGSQGEFDVQSLVSRWPERHFLELGRSCVLPQYRSKRTAELLWHGIWAYCRRHGVDVMFGCASFPGIPAARHALPLSFLYHHARAEGAWRAKAASGLAARMDMMPVEAVGPKSALAAMPPLIKGYLRLGAKFGGSAVADPCFGTTDVLVILRAENISGRYLNHFGHDATRFA